MKTVMRPSNAKPSPMLPITERTAADLDFTQSVQIGQPKLQDT